MRCLRRYRVTIAAFRIPPLAAMPVPPRLHSAVSPARLRRHIRAGGIVAYPTESCFGLGCDPGNVRALRRLVRMKKRPQHKGLIVIGAGLGQLEALLRRLPEPTRRALQGNWPSAKTFVLPASERVLPLLRGRGRGKLAVRVPDHAGARALCALAGTALVSTSCNRAGKRACRSGREVRRQFGREVLLVGGRTGTRKGPSDIIDWDSQSRLR